MSSTAISIVTEKQQEVAKNLDNIVTSVMQLSPTANGFERAYVHSSAISKIADLLTPEYMAPIMTLQGKKLGFKTDKDASNPQGYGEDTVKNCIIEATLLGVEVTGNQFNIIGGNMYITKEGFTSLLRKLPLPLVYDIVPSLPFKENDITVSKVDFTWTYDGKSFKRSVKISVRVNSGMSIDAILGKVERKSKAWLYNEITKKELGDGDIQDTVFEEIKQKPAGEKEKTQTQTAATQPQQQTEQVVEKPTKPTKNDGIEEAEIIEETSAGAVVEEEPIVDVTPTQQTKFDRNIQKATTLADLEIRKNEVVTAYKIKNYKSFNLDIYNGLLSTLK